MTLHDGGCLMNGMWKRSLILAAGFGLFALAACSDGPTAPNAGEDIETDGLPPAFTHTSVPHSSYDWFQGFEVDTDGWVDFAAGTVNREPSGFTNQYASGVASAEGDFHARLRTTQAGGCALPFSQGTSCGGPFNRWGKAVTANPDFPAGGYVTEVDVYLDVDWAGDNPDWRFDFSSAINNSDGNHLRDFAFNAGTNPGGGAEWIVGASTNAFRSNSFPSNPCPSPSAAPNECRAPVTITVSGWYTFQHTFRDEGGVLAVDMKILDGSGAELASWTIFADPMAGVGGDRYGWFANQEIHNLAIDNSGKRGLVVAPADPTTRQDCMNGGWEDFGFKNQGQCIRFVNTGKDSR